MAIEDQFNSDDIREMEEALDRIEREHNRGFITNRSFFDWEVELEDLGW